jgi:hypothetical protein
MVSRAASPIAEVMIAGVLQFAAMADHSTKST